MEASGTGAGRKPMVVVVTGLSGAGRTTALHALEDLGFFCIDNLPTALAPDAVALCEKGGMTRVALGIDVRVRVFLGEVGRDLSLLDDSGRRDLHVLFLDASDETILRRFSETRRPHALATSGTLEGAASVLEGVTLERERLAPLRARATRVVDTTALSVHELRRTVLAQFGPASGTAERMALRIVSFGFKYGTPADADLVFDVRFLKNPYFVPELKRVPGTDPRVRAYVLGLPETPEFLSRTLDLLEYVVPNYEKEGKSYLTIAFGCTGGMHRSVVMAEHVAAALDKKLQRPGGTSRTEMRTEMRTEIKVVHRDVGRGEPAPYARPPQDSVLPLSEVDSRPPRSQQR
ncbi:putative ATP-binding protein [Labilithrix luteola]|uniref:Putative ATP-binding protein n=1 Tax=Labilithrix luteola TaxID=1391654 RepID=A0A0K1QA25_9BACT|nr:putative ATP-binding protein [Labilithrix luteola]